MVQNRLVHHDRKHGRSML